VARARTTQRSRALVIAGLGALTAFLVALVFVFVDEDAARRGELDASRAALEAYATATLHRALEDEWKLGVGLIDAAVDDPLLDDTRLVLVAEGQVVLPRRAVGTGSGIAALAKQLAEGAVPDVPDADDPAAERRGFLRALRTALDSNDRPAVERAVRGLLAHRRLHRLTARDDLSATLAMVEVLQTRSTPARSLLAPVLREGFGPAEPGLQRHVLREAPGLTPAEVTALCALVEAQARRAQVPVDDFVQRCRDVITPGPSVPLDGPAALSLREGRLLKGSQPRGVTVDAAHRLELELRAMQERGLLAAEDRLALVGAAGPLEALRVTVESPRWQAAAAERARALGLKLGLLALAFALGLGLVTLVFVVRQREAALVDARAALVATVSHELRTPLASLRVMAETLERKLDGVPQAKDWPARIVGEVDGLTVLVENILAFNRLEQGRDLMQLEPLPLSAIAGWLSEDAGGGVALATEGLDDQVIAADPTWLRIAVLNLLRNARTYNERQPVTFSVVARADGGRVVVDFTDNGVGIPAGSWESVFEAFHRLRDGKGRGRGGSGLGLALVRTVVAAHGGSVCVAASSAAGTTFRVELPLRA
jgi:signal transduction histidine kinase